MNSPTAQSLKLLRGEGWTVAIVERWNPHAKIRQDLFGFCDLLCVRPGGGTMAVQTTTGDNFSKRMAKIALEPRAAICLAAGWKIEVHGWRKIGARGKRKTWECRREFWVPDRTYLPTEPIVKPAELLTRIAGQRELFP